MFVKCEMSIPSKDKARARHPKRIPGKGQKFTLTMVQYLSVWHSEAKNEGGLGNPLLDTDQKVNGSKSFQAGYIVHLFTTES